MKRRNIVATLLAVGLALGTAVGSPAAVAAQCQYVAQDMPLPSGVSRAQALASNEDNSLVLGKADNGRGVIWRNGVVEQLAAPTRDVYLNFTGINSHGVVIGDEYGRTSGGQYKNQAFRYVNGSYGWLFTLPDEHSFAVGINDSGDIVGTVAKVATPNERKVVVWRQNQIRYQSFGSGYGSAITPDRKIITNAGALISLVDRSQVQLGDHSPFVVDDNRIFGWQTEATPEWDLDGRRVRTYAKGLETLGVNRHGTLFGSILSNSSVTPALWRDGQWTVVQADKRPATWPFGDITDDDVLIGNYRVGNEQRAARWVCSPQR